MIKYTISTDINIYASVDIIIVSKNNTEQQVEVTEER